jgi:prepilin-type N-terminal cleavage/methylation domain-containing protein
VVKNPGTRKTKIGRAAGFTLTELSISVSIFSIVSIGLLLGFTSLERSYTATNAYTINHADQLRISDYLSVDLRRAVAVQAAQNDTSIYIPSYYDANGAVQTPTLDGKGGVYYGAQGSSIKVRYYLSDGSIFRQEGNGPPVLLAGNVQGFVFDVTDIGKVVKTKITFNPRFVSAGASSTATASTAFYNTTLLRNTRTDVVSGVY